jgi:predicted histone-like DNA-binding protein
MLKFRIIPKVNPREPENPPKYYASNVSQGEVNVRDLAEQITAQSTVTTIDTLAVLEALLKVIPRELSNGKIVRLGDLGSFRLTLSSEGSEQSDDFNASMIKGTKLHFRGGKLFRNVLRNIDFVKVKTDQNAT